MNWRHKLLMAGVSGLALMSIGDEGDGGGAGGAPAGGEGGAGAAPEGGDPPAPAAGEGEGAAGSETTGSETAGAGDDSLGGGAGDDDLGGGEGDAPPKRVPWYQKRIDQTTAEKRRLEEENARLRALVGTGTGGGGEGAGGEGTETAPGGGAKPPAGRPGGDVVYTTPDGKPLYTEEQLAARASTAAQINTLNQKCEKLYEDGKSAFKDFDKRLAPMNQAFGQELARRLDFFEVLTDLDNAPAVFHELAGDLDRLEEVLALPPHRLGAELAKMSAKAGKPVGKEISKAPAPITPVDGGAGAGEPDLAKVDMKTYEEIREKQRAERYAARGGR